MSDSASRVYRQGDVLVREVRSIPARVSPVDRDGGRIVLAYGEVTGHAHVIDAPPDEATFLSSDDRRRFLAIVSTVQLIHEEHASITLPPGLYEVVRQREWTDADGDEERWAYAGD